MHTMSNKKDGRIPEGRAGRKAVVKHRGRQREIHLGSRFEIWAVFRVDRRSSAQVSPINVGAQVFAANGTLCFSFYGRAFVGRYISPY